MENQKWIQRLSQRAHPVAAVVVVPDNIGHTGIAYEDDGGVLQFLHLALHYKLKRDVVDRSIGWVLPAKEIHMERLEHVAAMCERVWVRHSKHGLPYGFRYYATRFREDGSIEIGPDERGLTCATFVLAVFRSVGLEILKIEEWRERPDDSQRFELLLALLEGCADRQHIAAVKQETKAIRYRPLEVAGGSHYKPPASFADASNAAIAIEAELRAETT